ncbi:MAG: aminopeptidase P family N-terminal domain-containing protein, partial [Natronospirillum sp.]
MDYVLYEHALRAQLAGSECCVPVDELLTRQKALLAAMANNGLDVLLITDPSDLYYLIGYNTFEVSVHACLVFSSAGCVLQVPSIETGPAVTCTHVSEVLGYRWEQPGELVEQLLGALPESGCIGLDSWSASLRHGVADGLVRARGKRTFVNASGLVD